MESGRSAILIRRAQNPAKSPEVLPRPAVRALPQLRRVVEQATEGIYEVADYTSHNAGPAPHAPTPGGPFRRAARDSDPPT